MRSRSSIAGLVLLALTAFAPARPVKLWSPDELAEKAEVVVNGEVVSQKPTGEKINLLGKPEFSTRVMEATIKTIQPLTGETPPTFTFLFASLEDLQGLPNGPELVSLQDGQTYRFYLKKKGAVYVSALDGEFDDRDAVQKLPPGHEKLAPISEAEAVAIARKVFQRLRPSDPIVDADAWFNRQSVGEGWTTLFSCQPPLSYPTYTFDAEIIITDQRAISPRSWISRETPRPAQEFSQEDIGPLVRLTVKGDLSNGSFHPAEGNISSLVGHIESADDVAIRGRFTGQWAQGEDERAVFFPRAALASVQRLFSPEEVAEAAIPPAAPTKATLSFQIAELSERSDAPDTTLRTFHGRTESLPVRNTPLLTETDIQKITEYHTGDSYGLILLLQPESVKKLDAYIEAHQPARLAIVADGQVLLAPKLTGPTGGRIRLPAMFTETEAKRLVEGLTPPKPATP